MKQTFYEDHFIDKDGHPAGGTSTAVGLSVIWQNGPLKRGDVIVPPNGAFVETLIAVARGRLEFYQKSKFACVDNQVAIDLLNEALKALERRTLDRVRRGVEGTHAV